MQDGLNLSRKQSDLIHKEDFESKISKMSDRIQKEIKDAEKTITLPQELFSPQVQQQMRRQKAASDMKSPVKLKEYEIAEASIIHETFSENSDMQPIPDKLPLTKKHKEKI